MKNFFKNYHLLSTRQIKTIWENGIFIPDANVLISLYRFPAPTTEALLDIFKKLSDQMWIPHQVAQEYYLCRLKTIYDQEDAYESMCSTLNHSFEAFEKDFDKVSLRHPFIESKKIKEDIKSKIDESINKLSEMKKKHPKWSSNDSILKKLEEIFKGKTGKTYDKNKLQECYQEAEERYKINIPPGYEDKDKEFPKKYGDYIIWKQILDKSKEDKKPVIFITNDQKEDWWLQINGKYIGARYELCEEFNKETRERFYIYDTLRFIKFANKYLEIPVNKNVESQIEEIIQLNEKFKKMIEDLGLTSQIANSLVATGPLSDIQLPGTANTNVQLPVTMITGITESKDKKKRKIKK